MRVSVQFSICLYYLAIIRYNKKYDYIKQQLEPFFHAVSILTPLCCSISCLVLNAFNKIDRGSICQATPYNPTHCIGYEDGDVPDGFSIP